MCCPGECNTPLRRYYYKITTNSLCGTICRKCLCRLVLPWLILNNTFYVELVLTQKKSHTLDCRQIQKGHTHPPWSSWHTPPARVLTFCLKRIPCIHLHPGMTSRALNRNRFACPLQAGKPRTKVYPCMVAAMADHKAAWEFHARSHGITWIWTRPGRSVKVSGVLRVRTGFQLLPGYPDAH